LNSSIKKSRTKRQMADAKEPATLPDGPEATGAPVDMLRDSQGGVLALALRLGLQTLQEMLAVEVDALVGPKGQHNARRTGVRHGIEDDYVYVGSRKVATLLDAVVRLNRRFDAESPGDYER